jgi:hypothetical protein
VRVQKGDKEPNVSFERVPYSQLPVLQQALTEFLGAPGPLALAAPLVGSGPVAKPSARAIGQGVGNQGAYALGKVAGAQWKAFKKLFADKTDPGPK